MTENEIGTVILREAIHLHRATGPGLLESVYEKALAVRLSRYGVPFERQVPVDGRIDGVRIEAGFRADLVVAGKVIVELKAVEQLNASHKRQLLTYLRFSGLKLGYLLNFGETVLKNGIVRIINGELEE